MDGYDTLFLGDFQTFGVESHAENYGWGLGCDIGKATDACKGPCSSVGIDISVTVCLQTAHKADIQPTVVVQVKLVCHIINGSGTNHCPKCFARNRKSPDSSGLHRERDHIEHPALSRISGYHFRNSDSYVYNIIHSQLFSGSFSYDICRNVVFTLLLGEVIDLLIPGMPFFVRDLKTSGKCRVCFISLLRLCHNDRIDQTARNDGVTRTGRRVYETIHLYDDLSTVCFDRLTDGQCVAGHEHIIKGDISFSVCSSSLDHGNRDLWKFIIKKFIPIHFHMLHQ
ncbi:unknown [Blautia sp. CAG:237]|nr:unknown [Blautia sp. CAG:237]